MNKKNTPFSKKAKSLLHNMTESNILVFIISLLISFFVWVAVAMYASPEESFTIYSVPININIENSLVAENGYKNFWQSDDKIDVVVTGPRYMVTTMTAEDLNVSVNLNNVDSAGVSEVSVKVALKSGGQDITISSYSKKTISVYFDSELEKTFDIHIDKDAIAEKIADERQLNTATLTAPKITLKGPATEIKKIVDVVANPMFPDELLFETQTLPVRISLEGESAADTVSINKYIDTDDIQDNNVKISIDRIMQLEPAVAFEGTKTGDATVSFNTNAIIAKVDTEYDYSSETITILTMDYADLKPGRQTVQVKASDVVLPDGVRLTDQTFTFNIEIYYTAASDVPQE